MSDNETNKIQSAEEFIKMVDAREGESWSDCTPDICRILDEYASIKFDEERDKNKQECEHLIEIHHEQCKELESRIEELEKALDGMLSVCRKLLSGRSARNTDEFIASAEQLLNSKAKNLNPE